MQSTLAPLEGNKVKLSVDVGSAEVDRAVDEAARKLAREVRMPGFRPGKVPRRVLEAKMGHAVLRQEALRESLPEYYASAVREHEVDVIAPPEIDITAGEEGGDLHFDAVVEIRPTVSIPGYAGLQVAIDRPDVTDEDIDRQVDRLRSNAATLEEADRPATTGDVLTIDLGMTPTDDGVEGSPTELTDVSYTVGSEEFGVPDLDTQLEGATAGDVIRFTSDVSPERSMAFHVLVKAIREQVLPEATDAWASEETEFDTLKELRDDLRTRVASVKRMQGSLQLREKALEALAELVAEDVPSALVDAEVERRLHDLGHRLEHQGATIEQYLMATGQEPQAFVDELRSSAVPSVKVDLALRALADAEELDASEEDVDDEIVRLAGQVELTPAKVRENLVTSGQMPAVRSDVRKAKALAWLMEHVDVVDPEGQPIDRTDLEPAAPELTAAEPAPDEPASDEAPLDGAAPDGADSAEAEETDS
jgi:trigger factor